MKIRMSELRKLIRQVLSEGPSGPGVTADPTEIKGFYPYEVERGVDVQSYWYRSPARQQGTDGDPGRPADAAEYIGFKTKGATPEDAAEQAKPKEETIPVAETK
jgi:hypothetical protein